MLKHQFKIFSFFSLRVIHTSRSWRYFKGFWVTASLQKFFSVFRPILRIRLVWMVSIHSLISNSSRSFSYPLEIVPSMLITDVITVTFMLHSFFSSLARSKYLILFSFSFIFIVCLARWQNLLFSWVSSFFVNCHYNSSLFYSFENFPTSCRW